MVPYLEHAALLNEDLAVAVAAAAKGGAIVRRSYGQVHAVSTKSLGDLVTEVDIMANKAIVRKIRRRRPDDAIQSEELSPDRAGTEPRCWTVDPLDATSAFLLRLGKDLVSVMIALRLSEETILGVVFFPLTGEWFYGVRGGGAFKNGRRIATQPPPDLRAAWVEMNHHANSHRETTDFRLLRDRLRLNDGARLVTTQAPHSGIGVRIAEGREHLAAVIHDNDGAPELLEKERKQAVWDIAAPQLILEEAGGCVVDAWGQRYNPSRPGLIILAADHHLASQIGTLLNNARAASSATG